MADQTPDAMMYVGVEAIPGDIDKLLREVSGLTKAAAKNPLAIKFKIADDASAQATANMLLQKVTGQSSKAYAEFRKLGVEAKKAESMVENIINEGFASIIASTKTKGGPLASAIESAVFQGLLEGVTRAEAKFTASQASVMGKAGKQSSSYGAMQNKAIQQYEQQARRIEAENSRNQLGPAPLSASQIAANQRRIEAENSRNQLGPAPLSASQIAANQRRIEAENARNQRQAESPFSRANINRLAKDIKREYGLYGEALFQAADHTIDDMLARAGAQFGVGSARYRQVEHRLQRAFGKEVESRRLIGQASIDAMTQEVLKSMGSTAGTSVGAGQIREALRNALADRQARRTTLNASVAAGRATPQEREDAFKARQDVSELERRLQAVDRIEREKARIQERIERNQGSRFFGGIRGTILNRQMEQKNAEMQKLYGGGPMGGKTSAHGAQFAAMNAAYGFQDFFQVLAQPGMGPGRAFLAAANNIGPALAMIGSSAVGATVAVGGLMAGMAAANYVMGKSGNEAEEHAKKVKEVGDAYQKLMDTRNSFIRSIQSSPSSTGAAGFSDLFGTISSSSSGAEGFANKLRQIGSESRYSMAGGGTIDKVSGYSSWSRYFANRLESMMDSPRRGFGMLPLEFGSEKPLKDREDILFREPRAYRHAIREDPSIAGVGRDRYNEFLAVATKELEAMKSSGLTKEITASIVSQENIGQLIEIAMREAKKSPQRTIEGFNKAGRLESSLGIQGLRSGFISNVYSERQSAAELEMSARGEVDRLLSDPERIKAETEMNLAKAGRKAALSKGDPTFEFDWQIQKLSAVLNSFQLKLDNAQKSVELFGVQAKESSRAFDLLAKTKEGGVDAVSKILPGMDVGGVVAAAKKYEESMIGVAKFREISGGLHPEVKGKIGDLLQSQQFGGDFASKVAGSKNIMAEFEVFRGMNLGNNGMNSNRGIAAGRDLGKLFGFDVETASDAVRNASRNLKEFESILDEIAKKEPRAANAIAGIKNEAARDLFRKQGFGMSLETRLKDFDKMFAGLKPNLDKLNPEDRAEVEKQAMQKRREIARSPFSDAGFGMSLETRLKDFDRSMRDIEPHFGRLSRGDEAFVRQQAAQKRFQMIQESPDEVSRRGAMGGYVDRYRYGGTTGKVLNFEDRIRALREQYAAERMQPGLGEEGVSNLAKKHRRSVEREVSGMVDGSSGKTTMMDSGSLWQRIQESLTSDPSLEIERSQLNELRRINDSLMRGIDPQGGRFGEWLNPLQQNVPGVEQAGKGPGFAANMDGFGRLNLIAENGSRTNVLLKEMTDSVVSAIESSVLVIS